MSEIPLSEKLLNVANFCALKGKPEDAITCRAAAQVCKAAEDWQAGQREAIEADRISQTSPEFDARWSAAHRKIAKAEQAILASLDAAVQAGKGTPR